MSYQKLSKFLTYLTVGLVVGTYSTRLIQQEAIKLPCPVTIAKKFLWPKRNEICIGDDGGRRLGEGRTVSEEHGVEGGEDGAGEDVSGAAPAPAATDAFLLVLRRLHILLNDLTENELVAFGTQGLLNEI